MIELPHLSSVQYVQLIPTTELLKAQLKGTPVEKEIATLILESRELKRCVMNGIEHKVARDMTLSTDALVGR